MNEPAGSPPGTDGTDALTERVRRLGVQMVALTDAVEVLARGLESSPMAGPPDHHVEEAARRAHELLLLARSAAAHGEPGEAGPSS